jgi:hypothetical protein
MTLAFQVLSGIPFLASQEEQTYHPAEQCLDTR